MSLMFISVRRIYLGMILFVSIFLGFGEVLESVVWYLSLILKNSQPLSLWILLLLNNIFSLLGLQIWYLFKQVLMLQNFYFPFFLISALELDYFLLTCFPVHWSCALCVQLLLHSYTGVFISDFVFFFSVLKCPSDFFFFFINSNSLFKFSVFSPLFSLFSLTC